MSERQVTALDVARRAGVSRSAVSRTFTDGASVAPDTRDKVLEAAASLGYRVNSLARSLILRRSELVALVVSDMDHSFRARTVDLLARGLVAEGYRPVLLPWNEGDDPARLIDMMLQYSVAGAIVTSDTPPQQIAEQSARWGVPLVLVNKAPGGDRAARVVQDTEAAGRMAAEVLKAAGCRRIAYVGQLRPSYTIDARKTRFLSVARELGLDLAIEVAGAAQNHAGGMEAAERFLASGVSVDGVHCANDFLAIGFIDRLRQAGLSAPADFALVGCDDIAEAAWPAYDLTTIRQDVADLASASLKALLARIAEPAAPAGTIEIGVSLVERASTRRPA
ncbi:LacI family DNA-binding transcriptional regulator [Pseudoroseicyclus tamaricis]|uniref:Substrate-binding domain-containing protein n=1 Tax=Pseudoroseicyclus tamaricis TaxID=2705421 RepID=A0A6B2JR86_9RHOB|nr:LacI family DNA-binding transcriptional regulator [Pseudoroseicyclus tamaricis]NDV01077.1 substrate-binding domain-containing protein [Pseudoroseicyclus tamaricis]